MKKLRTIFMVVLILQLLNLFIWSNAKAGYYIDELWSYGLANSYYEPFLDEIEGHNDSWHEPEYYHSYLVVNEGQAFSYPSVYDNQVQDVHPPLYYFLLHTICSLFPGVFSKWFGLGLNILFFTGAMWILFKIGQLLFGQECIISIIPVLLYGFSLGVMNTALYIRMYMVLVFFALLFVYLALLWLQKGSGYPLLVALFATTACGFLTQYFFVIFIFFVSAALVLWQLLHRRWQEGILFGVSVSLGLAVAVGIFPASISHVFQGNKGHEVLSQAAGALEQYGQQIVDYAKAVSREVLGAQQLWMVFVMLLLVGVVTAIVGLIKAWKEKYYKSQWVPFGILIGTVTGYFFVVVKIAPEVATRYQCLIYPFFFLGAVYLVWYICDRLEKDWILWIITVVCLGAFGVQYSGGMKYLYPGTEKQLAEFQQEYGTVPGIYVTEDSYAHVVINDCLFLQQQERSYVVDGADEAAMQQLTEQLPDEIVVYLSVFYVDQLLEEVMEMWNYTSAEQILDTDFTRILVLHR